MSPVNNPSALAAVPIMANPNPQTPLPNNQPSSNQLSNPQPKKGSTRRPLPPFVNLDHLRAVQSRALQEISVIEHNALAAARTQHPMESLPRAESNVRSVKRTRQRRKEVERILTEKILENAELNRQLEERIDKEREEDLRLMQEIAELEKLPDVQQDLVQVNEGLLTTDQIVNDFIASLDHDNDSPSPEQPTDKFLPYDSFEQTFGDLASFLIDCQPFTGTADEENDPPADFEPTLNPKCIWPSSSHLPEEFDNSFLLDEEGHTL